MLRTNSEKSIENGGERADGRRQRSEASRERIVQAMFELVVAGDVSPSAENVARRARVGLRTVFRHFDNMESLYRQIDSLITAEVLPIVETPLAAGDWRRQLLEILERRARIFERIMPFKIAADVHRHDSPFLERQMNFLARGQREVILAVLPAGPRKNVQLVESLDLVLSFDTWRRLRKEQQLPAKKARQIVERLIAGLVDSKGG